MTSHDIIVIGTSAGGVETLKVLVSALPADLPAAIFVVLHMPAGSTSLMPEILGKYTALSVAHAVSGEAIRHGKIYLAPPDYHLLLRSGYVQLTRGPRENRVRPAADPLFRSAARVYGRRVVGVILTGMLSDGTAGLLAVRHAGGVAIVQDPAEAIASMMPEKARDIAGADHILPLAGIVPLLVQLAHTPVSTEGVPRMTESLDPVERMPEVVKRDLAAQAHGERNGQSSVYTCPECGGVLWQVEEEKLLRFRCHVGHIYASEELLVEQSEALEAALWLTVRTFIEKATLARQMAAQRRSQGLLVGLDRLEEEAQQAEHYAALIRQYLLKVSPTPADEATTPPNGPVKPPPPASESSSAPKRKGE